jgi:hypothetical protein
MTQFTIINKIAGLTLRIDYSVITGAYLAAHPEFASINPIDH